MSPTEKKGIKIAAQNRKAFHDYFVEDRYEAGIELAGTEVKSIRAGTLNLKDSYCTVKDGELFVHSMHISPYEKGNIFNRDPVRSRRLLMHKREIRKLHALVKQDGALPAAADAQAGDPQAPRPGEAGRLRPSAPVRLFQGLPGKAGDRPVPGQEEL